MCPCAQPRHSLSPHSCMLTALKAIKQFLRLYHFQSWNECSRGSSICELRFWTFIFFPYSTISWFIEGVYKNCDCSKAMKFVITHSDNVSSGIWLLFRKKPILRFLFFVKNFQVQTFFVILRRLAIEHFQKVVYRTNKCWQVLKLMMQDIFLLQHIRK